MPESPRVLIVGAGPVGLASALELARFGIPSTIIEQRETTSWHPKTRNINTRTMEIARGWGRPVYERIRGIDTPDGWKSPIRFLRSATGEELGTIETTGFTGPGPDVSPALPVMSSQELLEGILLDAARATGLVDIRFGHTFKRVVRGAEPDATDAAVEVVDDATTETMTLTGAAIVAADGADSPIREQLGIALEGPRNIANFINCYFRADIERHIGDRTGVLLFVANPNAAGVLQPLDARGRWLCQIGVPENQWDPDTFTPDRCRTWIQAATGVEDLDPEILSVGKWRMNASVAQTLLQVRVLLVGDAGHQFPPTGGLGVNTGIQAMHNAIWKLALFTQGKAGRGLLDTYNSERRPIARWIADQSLRNSQQVTMIAAAAMAGRESSMDPAEIVEASRHYGNHLGMELGANYEGSPAVIADGTDLPEVADIYSDYAPCARPGSRAPHVWLGRYSDLSTLDLVGPGFTVLAGPEGGEWVTAAYRAAREFDVPVASYLIGGPSLENPGGDFCSLYGIDATGAVLVRPDGYVAFRSPSRPDSSDVLSAALRQVLWQSTEPAR